MKVIAYYLPQFHAIPENDGMWGKGFTEWTNMKAAKPLFEGHHQPRIPRDGYYNLLDEDTVKWQIALAKENNIYGFCYYHYWFSGKLLLEKPAENLLAHKEDDIHFCFSWANEPWTNAWTNAKETKVFMPQAYGKKKEWKEHFDYLLPFFKDPRYIRNNDKPLFIIYRASAIPCLNEMLDYWQELATENGLKGIEFAYQNLYNDKFVAPDESRFAYNIYFEPGYAHADIRRNDHAVLRSIKRVVSRFLEKYTKFTIRSITTHKGLRYYDYDQVWNNIINRKVYNDKVVLGAYVDWDNTPRRKNTGIVHTGVSVEKFEKYFLELLKKAKQKTKTDMVFLFAWNEWCEGGHLEPDTVRQDGFLKAIKKDLAILDENDYGSDNNKQ